MKSADQHFAISSILAVALAILQNLSGIAAEYDLIIRRGTIVDGSGKPRFDADLAIDKGIIVAIGSLNDMIGTIELDAAGKIVAPGFIDMMGQTASPLISQPESALNLLSQGITTINAGEGISAAPISPNQEWKTGYTSMAEYFHRLESVGLPVNVAQTVGHTQIRKMVLGETDRRPSDSELRVMQQLVRRAMKAGAIGVSSALIYPPAIYAHTQELIALATAAGESGGRYFTHMRNEGDRVLEAFQEAISIGQNASTPVHIFHLKAAGQTNWGKISTIIQEIKSANRNGLEVTADIYPYLHNGLGILAFIHPHHFAQGRAKLISQLDNQNLRDQIRKEIETTDNWENWFQHINRDWNRLIIGHCNLPKYKHEAGLSLAAIATAHQEDPWEIFFQLAKVNAFVLPETMSASNKELLVRQSFVSYCTDVGPAASKQISSHPRSHGSFPRLIKEHVKENKVISLEQAICQASSKAAKLLFAERRGELNTGWAADIIIFDESKLTDHANFKNPRQLSTGIEYVLVNGHIAYQNQNYTGVRTGTVIRGPGYQKPTQSIVLSPTANSNHFKKSDSLMQDFLRKHKIPGAAIAVTDSGELTYSAGYGFADLRQSHPVEPHSLFRIASLSKPITAVAILQLIEKRLLNLDDRIYEKLRMADAINQPSCDPRLAKITVEHLLEHRGGWDRKQSFDPMFKSVRFADQLGIRAPANSTDIIRAMMPQKLDFDPGQRYAYSNFGYCLLGRLIEKITAQSYEDYVKLNVLAPLGIHSMRLGNTKLAARKKNEVRYYHPHRAESIFAKSKHEQVASPYGGWFLEAMDSHGGWLASAQDLATFASAFDNPDHCPILSRESIARMFQRPNGLAGYDQEGNPKTVYYSLGWSNRDLPSGRRNHWHSGSLPGTTAVMIRRHDGRNFVGLLNTRVTPTGRTLGLELDRLLHRMVDLGLSSESLND